MVDGEVRAAQDVEACLGCSTLSTDSTDSTDRARCCWYDTQWSWAVREATILAIFLASVVVFLVLGLTLPENLNEEDYCVPNQPGETGRCLFRRTTRYCELGRTYRERGTMDFAAIEYFGSFSNFFYVFFGLMCFYLHGVVNDSMLNILAGTQVFLGFGSFFFHYYGYNLFWALDVIPIVLLLWLFVVSMAGPVFSNLTRYTCCCQPERGDDTAPFVLGHTCVARVDHQLETRFKSKKTDEQNPEVAFARRQCASCIGSFFVTIVFFAFIIVTLVYYLEKFNSHQKDRFNALNSELQIVIPAVILLLLVTENIVLETRTVFKSRESSARERARRDAELGGSLVEVHAKARDLLLHDKKNWPELGFELFQCLHIPGCDCLFVRQHDPCLVMKQVLRLNRFSWTRSWGIYFLLKPVILRLILNVVIFFVTLIITLVLSAASIFTNSLIKIIVLVDYTRSGCRGSACRPAQDRRNSVWWRRPVVCPLFDTQFPNTRQRREEEGAAADHQEHEEQGDLLLVQLAYSALVYLMLGFFFRQVPIALQSDCATGWHAFLRIFHGLWHFCTAQCFFRLTIFVAYVRTRETISFRPDLMKWPNGDAGCRNLYWIFNFLDLRLCFLYFLKLRPTAAFVADDPSVTECSASGRVTPLSFPPSDVEEGAVVSEQPERIISMEI